MHKVLIACSLLYGCAVSPAIDPKASDNPSLLIEDKISCKEIAKQGSWFGANRGMFYSCLEGRGHGVVWPIEN